MGPEHDIQAGHGEQVGAAAEAPPAPPAHPVYGIANVTASILVFYVLVSVFGARSLYQWTTRLPVSKPTAELREVAERFWGKTAAWGLETPELVLEDRFLDLREAPKLVYPKPYAAFVRRRERRAGRPQLAAKVDKEILEEESLAGLDQAKGPKVLVLGDSIMMTVGPVLKKDIVSNLDGAAVVKAKLATGLARPDVFDWVREVKRTTVARRYDYVVMSLGTNDSQDFVDHGAILTYGTTAWVKAYNQRLAALMDAACDGARHGVWIGLPPMRSRAFNRKAVRINSWARRQVERHDCMQYIGLEAVLGDGQGRFSTYLKIDEQLEKVRMVDGIHVTAAGGSLVSGTLLEAMQAGLAH